jgi:hypothetical protein
MTHFLDHSLAAILVVLFPLHAWFETRRAKAKLRAGDAANFDTVADYKRTIATLVFLAALCLVMWFSRGRSAAALGCGVESSILRWAGGAALGLVGILLTQVQAVQVRGNRRDHVPASENTPGAELVLRRVVRRRCL